MGGRARRRRRRGVPIAGLIAALAVLSSCTATPSPVAATATARPASAARDPLELVLSLADVPAEFSETISLRSSVEAVAAASASPQDEGRGRLKELGFISGYQRVYGKKAAGLRSITTTAATFQTPDGARSAFGMNADFTRSTGMTAVPLERIGDEALAFQRVSGSPAAAAITVLFRQENVSESVTLLGDSGTFDVALAADLARRQLARLRP